MKYAAIVLILALLAPATALGYNHIECECRNETVNMQWISFPVDWDVDSNSLPNGSNGEDDFSRACYYWDIVKDQGWWYTINNSNTCTAGVDDAYDCVAMEPSAWVPSTYDAYAWWWSTCDCDIWGNVDDANVYEGDIAFDSSSSWDYGMPDPYDASTTLNFRHASTHEIGHVIQLAHQQNEMSVMRSTFSGAVYPSSTNATSGLALPHPDDRDGIRHIQPSSQGGEVDMAVINYRYYSGNISKLPTISPSSACPGDTVTYYYGKSNLGTSSETYDIGFGISTNNWMTSSDTWLATYVNVTSAASQQTYATWNQTVPYWVNHGSTYYFGTWIDRNADLTEVWEGNNRIASRGSVYIKQEADCP